MRRLEHKRVSRMSERLEIGDDYCDWCGAERDSKHHETGTRVVLRTVRYGGSCDDVVVLCQRCWSKLKSGE